jgi:dTDP-4-amino-4,6-dideoxygalactose transaminase
MALQKVLLNDFKKEYAFFKNDVTKQITSVLESGWYILGKNVLQFEDEFAKFVGSRFAIGVASGTDALTLALRGLGIDEGDGIVLPANVSPTVFGLYHVSKNIQLADITSEGFNLSLDTIQSAVTKKTKAIVLVHLYGIPLDIGPIRKFAKQQGIFLVEDCAQSHGAYYGNNHVGSMGDAGCFSFYPTKNLGAYGDAGAIVTNNKSYAEKLRAFRMYGEISRYKSVFPGYNSRLDELQAAILSVKLKKLSLLNKKRTENAAYYNNYLKDISDIILPTVPKDMTSAWHLFVIKTKQRDKLQAYLAEKGIQTGIHYPYPTHLLKSFDYLKYKKGDFPYTEQSSRMILSLPMHPFLSESDLEYVCSSILKFFNRK